MLLCSFCDKDKYLENPRNEIYSVIKNLCDLSSYLSNLVSRGQTVVLKPNLVRHFNENPNGTLGSVVTDSQILAPLIELVYELVGSTGKIIIADAPQHDCDIEVLKSATGLKEIINFYQKSLGANIEFRDLRQEFVRFKDGIIVERQKLHGDASGYTVVNLEEISAFNDELSVHLLRGADYDEKETIAHHSNGKNEYLVSNTILNADLIINIPKVKTHKKAGVTLAMKNLVGINGNKNFLPHYKAGFPGNGGDEYPQDNLYTKFRSWGVETARKFLKRGKYTTILRFARKAEKKASGNDFIRAGNWYGNDTIWRTIIDLNTILFYADKAGNIAEENFGKRKYLTVYDGIVCGEGDGPMATTDKFVGIIAMCLNPVVGDICMSKIMGFDWRKIPKLIRAVGRKQFKFTQFTNESQTIVKLIFPDGTVENTTLEKMQLNLDFAPHFGWKGHIELQCIGINLRGSERRLSKFRTGF